MSLLGALAVGASMVVVTATSTAAQAGPVNYAQRRPATGSTPCNADETPDKAVTPGVLSVKNKWCSTASSKWLEVALGSGVKKIGKFVIKHAGSGREPAGYNTRGYTISVRNSTSDVWNQVVSVTNNVAHETTHHLFVDAQYVRLDITQGTQPGSDGAARIYEFQAWSPTDLAFHKPVKASPESPCSAAQGPEKAVDAVPTSKWCNRYTPDSYPHRLTVDLGTIKTITGLKISHAAAGGESANYNSQYFSVKGREEDHTPTGAIYFGPTNEAITIAPLPGWSARYVTLTVRTPEQDNAYGPVRIYGFEVYGY